MEIINTQLRQSGARGEGEEKRKGGKARPRASCVFAESDFISWVVGTWVWIYSLFPFCIP